VNGLAESIFHFSASNKSGHPVRLACFKKDQNRKNIILMALLGPQKKKSSWNLSAVVRQELLAPCDD